jgi:hypothetical protein
MISLNELHPGGVYVLHDDEDGDQYRLCKVLSISGNDMWVILERDTHPHMPSDTERRSPITMRTSAEAFLTWGSSSLSKLLHVEAVTPAETASCDWTLYPNNPFQRVDPRQV